jgi:branched-chain amino acid transport system substrate-binding protein
MSKLANATLLFCLLGAAVGCLPTLCPQPTVKIGLVAPFEGLYRPLGYEALYAAKLALGERNEQGGVAGYLVELVALNDDQDPESAAQRAREMAVDPAIVGVIGHLGEETTVAVMPVYEEEGLALIVPASTATEVTRNGRAGVFRLVADDCVIGKAAAQYAIGEMGARSIVATGGTKELVECFVVGMEGSGASFSQIEEGGLISLLDKERPDLLFFGGDALDGAQLLLDLRGAGLETEVLGGNGLNSSQLVQIAGDAAEGVTYVGVTPPLVEEHFAEAYEAFSGQPAGSYAPLAYDATGLLLDALERSVAEEGRPSREGVIQALSATEGYEGVTGSISFDETGQALQPAVYVFQIVGGQYPGEPRECPACGQ